MLQCILACTLLHFCVANLPFLPCYLSMIYRIKVIPCILLFIPSILHLLLFLFFQHLVGTLLFAFLFTAILPCLVSAQDEPLVQAQVTITEQFPTAGSLDDFTEAASTDLPAEMDQAKYNVTFFEETVWPSKVKEINESDEFDICSMRNKTAHEVDFTNGGLGMYHF